MNKRTGATVKTYKTHEIAEIIGIHPNTVRLYEDLGLIAKPLRQENGYRIFTPLHIDQLRVARMAFQIEALQNGLRKKAVSIVKFTASCQFDKAIEMTDSYLSAIQLEILNANEAVNMVHQLLQRSCQENCCSLKRKEVSDKLGITMDTLRNWEMNGLLKVKRKENGYRVYHEDDMMRLKIIRSLRCANYSLSAILHLMNALDKDTNSDIKGALALPNQSDEIISVCDRLILSLESAANNASAIKSMLITMKSQY